MEFLKYQKVFADNLEGTDFNAFPEKLYAPVDYIMKLGGKRLRPTALLMSTDTFGGNIEYARNAAMALEVFHNFTLVHDDIMDEAPLRRGKETVHIRYDINTGILSGDVMLIESYELLFKYSDHKYFAEIIKTFNQAAKLVCHGQQLDVDFEERTDVTEGEYLKMIEWKTAVLFAAGLKIGALLADSTLEQANAMYSYGINVGLAFQVQDDILDSFGDPEKFGKKVGGDIIQGKKTLLVLKTLERMDPDLQVDFLSLINDRNMDEVIKVDLVKSKFTEYGALEYAEDIKSDYRTKASNTIDSLKDSFPKVSMFADLTDFLLGRDA
jgi:geranylgeranyl diphosphate synthase type II